MSTEDHSQEGRGAQQLSNGIAYDRRAVFLSQFYILVTGFNTHKVERLCTLKTAWKPGL